MRLFVATMLCGDYYCGCGNGHVIGVYASRELAEGAIGIARDLPLVGSASNSKAYMGKPEVVEVVLDDLPLGRKLGA